MSIARKPYFVLDCPEPLALATFYGKLLDWRYKEQDDWAKVFDPADPSRAFYFQGVEDYTPPDWPGQVVPQQMHIDVEVDDLDEAEAATLALGASKHPHQPGTTFRVLLDPAGHPFCLCTTTAD
jgi:hypothetical protein